MMTAEAQLRDATALAAALLCPCCNRCLRAISELVVQPTHLPMSSRDTPAASSSRSTAVAAIDTTSSLSPQNVIASCRTGCTIISAPGGGSTCVCLSTADTQDAAATLCPGDCLSSVNYLTQSNRVFAAATIRLLKIMLLHHQPRKVHIHGSDTYVGPRQRHRDDINATQV